ncbi:MAG: hypothetical protein ACT4O2_09340 [Beijerinckiaceae bacterium]
MPGASRMSGTAVSGRRGRGCIGEYGPQVAATPGFPARHVKSNLFKAPDRGSVNPSSATTTTSRAMTR